MFIIKIWKWTILFYAEAQLSWPLMLMNYLFMLSNVNLVSSPDNPFQQHFSRMCQGEIVKVQISITKQENILYIWYIFFRLSTWDGACCCNPFSQTTRPSHTISLLWRHNGRYGVSNHQPHDCLLNPLFRCRSKKTSKLRVTGLCAGNSPGLVNSPHKWLVTRKMFSFNDVIMMVNSMAEDDLSFQGVMASTIMVLTKFSGKYSGNRIRRVTSLRPSDV